MNHVMIDLETLGKANHAAIWTIGAVKFNIHHVAETIEELTDTTERFHVRLDMKSVEDVGLKMDAETIQWWMQAGRWQARESILLMPEVGIHEALMGFAEWYGEDKELPVWGNGATFDNVILATAYKACRLELPWSYKADRCYRTLRSLAPGVLFEKVGTGHTALDDALAQAWHAQRIVKHLDDLL